MKKFNKIISLLLTVTMLVSAIASLSIMEVGAASESEYPVIEVTDTTVDYTTQIYNNPEEKLATMTKYIEKGNFILYVDAYSGETATYNKVTGEVLFSNPYDVASSVGAESTKKEILSQLIVKFTDNNKNSRTFTSYEYAAERKQIKVKNIKNGVRIEYTIGREEARILVPRLIRAERFETLIRDLVRAGYNEEYGEGSADATFWITKFESSYQKFSIEGLTERQKQEILALYPICKNMDIYACDANVTETELNRLEEVIKTYAPEYSFDELDADHEETGYVAEDQNPPVFKMALEYSLTENGVSVRLPTNGIRYDESLYTIEHISVLPYMGAGHSNNTGYTFFPDGSGAIFRFEDLNTTAQTVVSGKIYGTDYAYHEITGTYQKQVTVPAYGLVENRVLYKVVDDAEKETIISGTVKDYETLKKEYTSVTEIKQDAGFFAVIEDGESLATIATTHDGAVSDYNHITMTFNPKPKDEYKLADSISVTQDANETLTVVSDRKYTGDFKVNYVMLTDDALALSSGTSSYYECSYIGMADAYRDILIADGVLAELTSSSAGVTSDIPLYLEVFGAIETTQQILSMPVDVMTPLTTFEDVEKIYKELSNDENGIKNINFKMTGFINGGLRFATAPYRLKWERNVGGKSGLEDLIKFATSQTGENNLGLYPDANFAYVQGEGMFDGYNYRKHDVRTIDDRYTSKRYYSATQQKYSSFFEMAVSPAYYAHFYEKFMKSYEEYKLGGISVGSLGNSLNSDFDEDEPFNREDNKGYTAEAFDYISSKVDSVMTDKGNAYTWKYVDHILNLSLDSSRYTKASASVPFIGIVLHGYKQYAGEALNMEGDMDYAVLKAIENGASAYFVLSYQNTEELKEDFQYSSYYSINYNNWKETLVEMYHKLNDAISDVQLHEIIDHKFLTGTRVLDPDEIRELINQELAANKDYQDNLDAILALEKLTTISEARKASKAAETLVLSYKKDIEANLKNINNAIEKTIPDQLKKVEAAYKEYENAVKFDGPDSTSTERAYIKYTGLKKNLVNYVANAVQYLKTSEKLLGRALDACNTAELAIDVIKNAEGTFEELITEAENNAVSAKSHIASIEVLIDELEVLADQAVDMVAGQVTQEDIDKRLEILNSSDSDDDDTEEEDAVDTKYVADPTKIVSVTYGDGGTAYKTFILNYNSYTVLVEYNGTTYSIESGDFVTIYHNK